MSFAISMPAIIGWMGGMASYDLGRKGIQIARCSEAIT
jgi:hypothetical protein